MDNVHTIADNDWATYVKYSDAMSDISPNTYTIFAEDMDVDFKSLLETELGHSLGISLLELRRLYE